MPNGLEAAVTGDVERSTKIELVASDRRVRAVYLRGEVIMKSEQTAGTLSRGKGPPRSKWIPSAGGRICELWISIDDRSTCSAARLKNGGKSELLAELQAWAH